MTKLIAALCVLLPSIALAEPPTDAEIVALAKKLKLNTSPDEVEAKVQVDALPDVSFDRCVDTECVEDVGELRATRMLVMWGWPHNRTFLHLFFCKTHGEWKLESIDVTKRSEGRGGFGTTKKAISLFKSETRTFLTHCWRD